MEKKEYMVRQAFKNWNDLKRFDTLVEIEREKERGDVEKFESMKYKAMMKMELSLRGLQTEIKRENNSQDQEEEE